MTRREWKTSANTSFCLSLPLRRADVDTLVKNIIPSSFNSARLRSDLAFEFANKKRLRSRTIPPLPTQDIQDRDGASRLCCRHLIVTRSLKQVSALQSVHGCSLVCPFVWPLFKLLHVQIYFIFRHRMFLGILIAPHYSQDSTRHFTC